MAEALEKLFAEHEDREAREHLAGECPWFRLIEGGGREHPDMYCRQVPDPRDDGHEGGALVKFTPRTPEASTVPQPTVPPGGPGLFHVKGLELPPYVQHLYKHLVGRYGKHGAYRVAVGVVKKWAEGVNPGGYKTKSGKGKRTHPDVRAAAQRNVALWEKDKAAAHAQSAAREAKATAVGLAGQMMTAPGARPAPVTNPGGGNYAQYGLHQHPAATISPSPPLPPDVKLPTPAEVLAVLPLIPECSKPDLSATARKFIEQAAGKIERGNPIEALGVLRSAQAAVYAAHKADLSELMPAVYTANVFAAIPPAAQSSATTSMKQGQAKQLAWRKAEQQTAALADRIRKKFFHGLYNGPSQLGRFTEDGMSALDRVLALAGAPITTGKDVSFPSTSDVSGRTPLIQPPEDLLQVNDRKAAEELASMPVLDRAKFTAYLDRARAMLATNRSGAAQSALRAVMIARECGAHHLARHVHHHVQALADMGNVTRTGPEAGRMSHGKAVSPQNSPQKTADTGNQTPAAHLSAVERLELAVHAGRTAAKSSSPGAGQSDSGGPWLPKAQYDAKERRIDTARAAAVRVPGEQPAPKAGTVIHSRTAPAGEPGPVSAAQHLHGLHQLHEHHLAAIAAMHQQHLAGR
jgi:hypothetical protein